MRRYNKNFFCLLLTILESLMSDPETLEKEKHF